MGIGLRGTPAQPARDGLRLVVLCDRYPVGSETFVATEVGALRKAGTAVRVESLARPEAPGEALIWEQETTPRRAAAMAYVGARRPRAVVRDLVDRRRWRREEWVPPLRMLAPAAVRLMRAPAHVHAHFAGGAALAALRLSRVTGVPFSVTAHGYDIFERPANLREKLEAASFATSGSDYTVRHLRDIAPDARLHRIVMGIDGSVFRRTRPHPERGPVLAVGRLVEKKGFADLVDAAAELGHPVRIAGEGPLRPMLERRIFDTGAPVELVGPVDHTQVREMLEQAAVLCMPCVIAASGDRDSMPVVVKEALAMEVPVVATAAVGLPEAVRPQWGALVPPGDPASLAAALRAELDRPASERAARGRAGRSFVLAHYEAGREAERLAALVAEVGWRTHGHARPADAARARLRERSR